MEVVDHPLSTEVTHVVAPQSLLTDGAQGVAPQEKVTTVDRLDVAGLEELEVDDPTSFAVPLHAPKASPATSSPTPQRRSSTSTRLPPRWPSGMGRRRAPVPDTHPVGNDGQERSCALDQVSGSPAARAIPAIPLG